MSQKQEKTIDDFFGKKSFAIQQKLQLPEPSTSKGIPPIENNQDKNIRKRTIVSDDTEKEEDTNPKKRSRTQLFSSSWLEDPRFKGWLEPVENFKTKAMCKACGMSLGTKKSDLLNHRESKKHLQNVNALSNMKNLDETFKNKKSLEIENLQIFADLRYSLLIANHYISFRTIDHVTEISKMIFNDSRLSKTMKLKRTKCVNIIKNVLAPVIREEIILELQNKPFSILLDESTDISNTKLLCILVRYVHKNVLKTQLLDIMKIEADESTAKGLYSLFKKCLTNNNLDLNNIVGYCSDNASVMMGKNESFKTYLLKDNPHIITNGCICHSAHLVAVAAADNIPSNVETLLHNLYSYFSRSPKRQSVLEEIQTYFKKATLKILGPSKTRWLALLKCVERVLDQWDVLINLFRLAAFEDKNQVGNLILNELQNPFVKAYLMFFKFILPVFNQFNAVFQSEKVMIHIISTECERFIRQLCVNFVRPEYFNNEKLPTLNPYDPHVLLSVENIFVGSQTMDCLRDCDNNSKEQFKLKCLSFYQKAVEESLHRFPIKDNFHSELKFTLPKNALYNNCSVDDCYKAVLTKFSHIVNPDLAVMELKKLNVYFSEDEKMEILQNKTDIIEFWSYLEDLKNFNDEAIFENIAKIAHIILSLPHGNADVERTFSYMEVIKTKKRNRILPSSLSALLLIILDANAKKQCCLTYEFTEKHIQKYKNNLYNIERDLEETKESDSDN